MEDRSLRVPWMTRYSVEHPWAVIVLLILVTVGFATQFPKVKIDTDPKNMLPASSDVRVFNDQVDQWFSLYKDTVVLGIYNDKGIFNRNTLSKVASLSEEIQGMEGVAAQDVKSLSTADDVTAEGGTLSVKPILTEVPQTPQEIGSLRKQLNDNPMLVDRLVSRDGKVTAIYIPLEAGANGKQIADNLRKLTSELKGDETYYVAGDPVARDTFGAEMFRQMGLFSPLAGLLMMVILWVMFRNLPLVFSILGAAMLSVVWSMGALIGLGYTVHIMSSMIPVFLMAIATDSIHIFNEFGFRRKEQPDKKKAILETMHVVGGPVTYTALATAAGFAVLALGGIIPVQVFGVFVAFGTLAIRLMSFTLLPAVMSLIPERSLLATSHEDLHSGVSQRLRKVGEWAIRRRRGVLIAGAGLFALSVVGIARIHVNNNMVAWFKAGSDVRQSDGVLNASLGGTSLGYLVVEAPKAEGIKDAAVMRYIEGLQKDLVSPQGSDATLVGKTVSIVDIVKRINRVLRDGGPEQEIIPDTAQAIGQYLFLFSMSAKPNDLNSFLDPEARRANIWVQLKTWDAAAMQSVVNRVRAYEAKNPPPGGIEIRPAGIAYFNQVWNDEVLKDMVRMFGVALVLVLVILILNFRSFLWGLISYVPLLLTIAMIYGFIGAIGKDFDMPISVLSTLSLGMAVDFSIHFIKRLQLRYRETGDLHESLLWTIARPGRGILRNALLFSGAFSVMVFASLTPYITVGLFIAFLMMISACLTLVLLPALILPFQARLFAPSPLTLGETP